MSYLLFSFYANGTMHSPDTLYDQIVCGPSHPYVGHPKLCHQFEKIKNVIAD